MRLQTQINSSVGFTSGGQKSVTLSVQTWKEEEDRKMPLEVEKGQGERELEG